jgi:hypothetical protein
VACCGVSVVMSTSGEVSSVVVIKVYCGARHGTCIQSLATLGVEVVVLHILDPKAHTRHQAHSRGVQQLYQPLCQQRGHADHLSAKTSYFVCRQYGWHAFGMCLPFNGVQPRQTVRAHFTVQEQHITERLAAGSSR